MDTQFWLSKWQSNDIGFNQPQPNKLLQRYFPTLNLKSGARILVPLCGKSIDMIWLAGQGYQVVGVELSQEACQAFFKQNKIPFNKTEQDGFVVYTSDVITLFAGDFFKFDASMMGEVDGVYDRAALIALSKNLRERYSKHLKSLIEPNTPVLLISTAYDQQQMQGPPFSVDADEVSRLYQQQFSISQLYSKEMSHIPEHLAGRGLMHGTEQVYLLIKKPQ